MYYKNAAPPMGGLGSTKKGDRTSEKLPLLWENTKPQHTPVY
jgi:hypothetical protein